MKFGLYAVSFLFLILMAFCVTGGPSEEEEEIGGAAGGGKGRSAGTGHGDWEHPNLQHDEGGATLYSGTRMWWCGKAVLNRGGPGQPVGHGSVC